MWMCCGLFSWSPIEGQLEISISIRTGTPFLSNSSLSPLSGRRKPPLLVNENWLWLVDLLLVAHPDVSFPCAGKILTL